MRTLAESILGDIDSIENSTDKYIAVERWCESAKTGPGHNHQAGLFLDCNKAHYKINKDFTIDIDNINMWRRGDEIGPLPDYIQFNRAASVSVDGCQRVMSMKGWPKTVDGYLYISESPIRACALADCTIEKVNTLTLYLTHFDGVKKMSEFPMDYERLTISLPHGCHTRVPDFDKFSKDLKVLRLECLSTCPNGTVDPRKLPQNLEHLYLEHCDLSNLDFPSGLKGIEVKYCHYRGHQITAIEVSEHVSKSCNIIT